MQEPDQTPLGCVSPGWNWDWRHGRGWAGRIHNICGSWENQVVGRGWFEGEEKTLEAGGEAECLN